MMLSEMIGLMNEFMDGLLCEYCENGREENGGWKRRGEERGRHCSALISPTIIGPEFEADSVHVLMIER
jgi:hypothetical protein